MIFRYEWSLLWLWLACVGLGACAHTVSSDDEKKVSALQEMGLSYYNDERYPDAIFYLSQALDKDPNRADIRMALGLSYMNSENLPRAEELVKKACTDAPAYADCWNNLSVIYLRQKKAGEAQRAARQALENPTYSTPEVALCNLARAALAQDQEPAARAAIEKAMRLKPEYCAARILFVRALIFENNFERALEEAKFATQRCPLTPEAHLWEAYAYHRLGQPRSARIKLERMIALFHNGPASEPARRELERLRQHLPLSEPKS